MSEEQAKETTTTPPLPSVETLLDNLTITPKAGFLTAIKEGHLARVKFFLDDMRKEHKEQQEKLKEGDPKYGFEGHLLAEDQDGWNFLFFAAGFDQAEVFEYLYNQAKDALKSRLGHNVWHIVAQANAKRVAARLRKLEIDQAGDCVCGLTALHVAARAGNVELCLGIMEHDETSLTKESQDGKYLLPIQYAASYGHKEILAKMFSLLRGQLRENEELQVKLKDCLSLSARRGHDKCVEYMCSKEEIVDYFAPEEMEQLRDDTHCIPFMFRHLTDGWGMFVSRRKEQEKSAAAAAATINTPTEKQEEQNKKE